MGSMGESYKHLLSIYNCDGPLLPEHCSWGNAIKCPVRVLLQKLLVIWYNEPQTMSTSEHRRPAMSDPSLFKWRHFEGEIILRCVRWYWRYALSWLCFKNYRHVRAALGIDTLCVATREYKSSCPRTSQFSTQIQGLTQCW
jgi:hypothetical protein